MSIDQARVGAHIAAQMEAIERDYGDDCQIGDICTVVEVLGPHGSHVRVRPSDARLVPLELDDSSRRGQFDVLFESGDDYGAGRTLSGRFSMELQDGRFEPPDAGTP